MSRLAVCAAFTTMLAAPALAAPKVVTLVVPGMTCPACPITVKKALFRVQGVTKVDVIYDKREAVVSFDDAKTSVQKLLAATESAGYPSSVDRAAEGHK